KPVLEEDWITSLSAARPGMLLVGFRSKGYMLLNTPAMQSGGRGLGVTRAVCIMSDGGGVVGTYGRGALRSMLNASANSQPLTLFGGEMVFPTPAPAPTSQELQAMLAQVQSLSDATDRVEILPDDWSTQGDWVGRYGRS